MRWHILIGGAAIAFGTLTILSGGAVLWGPEAVREGAGDIVLPVLWFNALSGPAYVAAGVGMVFRRAWAVTLSRVIAVAIAIVLGVFVALILAGSAWEARTLVAMLVRLAFWIVAARIASIARNEIAG
ncbi:hypothetical protein [Aliiruegeria sabulilitoris]|uniref:hypothetical protein n=1 Tax=Aliiruegeria sabulilitoris TaxID=1510458 RepID=UPI001E4A983D|nr:hypothetical protein [Aliiruegeria sabulilitoris]